MDNVHAGTDEGARGQAARGILGALTAPRSPAGPLLAALLVGAAYALAVFGADFALGRGAFWDLPTGAHRGHFLDLQNALAGYTWFAQAPWGWPILHVPQANPPSGVNGYLFDFVPLAALLGKLASGFAGRVVNPYPLWVISTFALNGAAVAVLARSFGQRSFLAAILAGGLGAMMPLVHHRFIHLGLIAHWPFIIATAKLVDYIKNRSYSKILSLDDYSILIIVGFIHIYIAVFVILIYTTKITYSFIVHNNYKFSILCLFIIFLIPISIIYSLGIFQSDGLIAISHQFGFYSMNLVSPFWPATSGVFSRTGLFIFTRGSIGATAGQYEGYAYLGIGALLLLSLALLRNGAALLPLARRYWVFVLLLAAFTLYALSNTIYAFHIKLISYPVPDVLERTVLGWFRAGGRFFWPVAYTLVALAVAGALLRLRPRTATALALAVLLLQWADLALWRERLRDFRDAPRASAFGDQAAWVSETIGRAGAVAVMPHLFCSAAGADYGAIQNIATHQVQLIAARQNAFMSDVHLARGNRPCSEEIVPVARPTVLVVLEEWRHRPEVVRLIAHMSCSDVAVGVVCAPTP